MTADEKTLGLILKDRVQIVLSYNKRFNWSKLLDNAKY